MSVSFSPWTLGITSYRWVDNGCKLLLRVEGGLQLLVGIGKGDAYGMAQAERVDVEEGERLFGFEELEAGDVACSGGSHEVSWVP
jgi:hypothetical protein